MTPHIQKQPKIFAAEIGPDGIFSRLEWVCGCVTVRVSKVTAPAAHVYLERCDQHGKNRPSAILIEPNPFLPEWLTR